jgi:hypothetical protein
VKPSLPLLLAFILFIPAALAGSGTSDDNPLTKRKAEILKAIEEAGLEQSIYIRSEERANGVSGSIYALMDEPFSELSTLLESPQAWCEITIIHQNVKGCLLDGAGSRSDKIRMYSGRMHYAPLSQANWYDYSLEQNVITRDYFRAAIHGPEGPFGTHDYRIVIEAVAAGPDRSLIHLGYSLGYTTLTRWAQKVYFATAGRDRIGFSQSDPDNDDLVRGLRGMIERNTVRFYLALQTWLEMPAEDEAQQRFIRWHELTEQHPDQLREQDLETYLDIKQREYANQQRAQRHVN